MTSAPPGTRVTDGAEPPSRCWELTPGSLKEYRTVLTTEPPLQPPCLQFPARLSRTRLGLKFWVRPLQMRKGKNTELQQTKGCGLTPSSPLPRKPSEGHSSMYNEDKPLSSCLWVGGRSVDYIKHSLWKLKSQKPPKRCQSQN